MTSRTRLCQLLQLQHRPAQCVDGGTVVGGQQHRTALHPLPQQGDAGLYGSRVHTGKGLVQQQGVPRCPEGPQQGRAALLPAAQLPGREGQRGLVQPQPGKVLSDGRFLPVIRQHQQHILHRRQLGAEPVLLEHRTHPPGALHPACSGRFQPHEDAQKGGLAPAAGGPQHRRAVHRKGQVPEQHRAAEALFQMVDGQHAASSSPPINARLTASSARRNSFSKAALSRMMTKVQANSSPVERVILAR